MASSLISETCPTCQRLFVPINERCSNHCSPHCCKSARNGLAGRRSPCPFIPLYRPSSSRPTNPRRCKVCHAPEIYFVPFPSNSIRLDHAPSPSYPPSQLYTHPSSGLVYLLDATRPRIHLLYCSVRCYCDSKYGHYARARGGRILRQHRYNDKHGHRPRELRRQIKEDKERFERQKERDERRKAEPLGIRED